MVHKLDVWYGAKLVREVGRPAMPGPWISDQDTARRRRANSAVFHPQRFLV